MSVIERIRERIRDREYILSEHAKQELREDAFDRTDMEHAILHGFVERKYTEDSRGTRYRIEGPTHGGKGMYVVCRFTETGPVIVITAFKKV